MKSLFSVLFCALMVIGAAPSVKAAEAVAAQGAIYTTTFVEVSPGSARDAMAALKQYRDATRKEPGMMVADLYQEMATPSRFVANEVWKDIAAYEAHAKAAATTQLFQKLKPIQYGPPDARTHIGYFVAPGGGAPSANSVFILSHLDVTPNALPKLMEIMKPLSEGSAKEAGMQTYQILRQAPGTGNHFRLFEIWASDKAFDAHNLAAHTQGFRNELYPLLGTPYDQRKYTPVN
ncbi:MAG TPA: antibiotic biosynthesis monooxygenase [Micropepsaceae bacterium]|nr:antibiotic biosynthesis monooxygenase [Micropepsaceae bacterium]